MYDILHNTFLEAPFQNTKILSPSWNRTLQFVNQTIYPKMNDTKIDEGMHQRNHPVNGLRNQ